MFSVKYLPRDVTCKFCPNETFSGKLVSCTGTQALHAQAAATNAREAPRSATARDVGGDEDGVIAERLQRRCPRYAYAM